MKEPTAHLDAVGSVIEALGPLVDVLYDRGFELASRVSAEGKVTATIANRRVAAARLRLAAPASAYFLVPETGPPRSDRRTGVSPRKRISCT